MEVDNTNEKSGLLKRAGKFLGRTGQIIFIERLITFLTRITDVAMVYFIWQFGAIGTLFSFFGVGIPYFLFCAGIVQTSEYFFARGHDITGLEELRGMATEEDFRRRWFKRYVLLGRLSPQVEAERAEVWKEYKGTHWFRRIVAWVLSSRKTIFWIGSWFYLDPDYVTLLLYRREKGFWWNMLTITLPSVTISMTVWTTVYYCAYLGLSWAVALI
jgi:hypothetical protein